MIFLQLFIAFLKIGIFGFGGGYAMISLIQGEVVTSHKWLSSSEFTDIVAVSQMTPGPIGINSATYVGYAAVVGEGYAPWMGILGSVVATLAVVLPSFLLMIVVIRIFHHFHDHPVVKSMLELLRPTHCSRSITLNDSRELRYTHREPLAVRHQSLHLHLYVYRYAMDEDTSYSHDCLLRHRGIAIILLIHHYPSLEKIQYPYTYRSSLPGYRADYSVFLPYSHHELVRTTQYFCLLML